MSYDNTNRGVLFTNDRKKNPKSPDREGEIDVDGKKYRLAGWIKESNAGKKFLSLKIEPKERDGKMPEEPREEF